MNRINIKRFLLAFVLVLVLLCSACVKGAPDDAYMIDLTAERDVKIMHVITYYVNGNIDKFRLFEQFIAEEFSDTFNSEIPKTDPVRYGDEDNAIKAAEYFLKEYFGSRYIDAGNGKAKVKFSDDGRLCFYNCGDACVVFGPNDGSFKGCYDLRIQTYLHRQKKSDPWVLIIEADMYKQSAEQLRRWHELDVMNYRNTGNFEPVYDAQTAFEAAKKLSRSTRGVGKEFKVYFSPYSNAWFVCNKYWIIAFGSDNSVLYSGRKK